MVPTHYKLPPQRPELVLLLAERYTRSAAAQELWATDAMRCVDYVEGRQWSAEALARMQELDRPALTINKIAPLVRLVMGYHRNNRTEEKYLPGYDGTGTDEVATALTHVARQINEMNREQYVSSEVFLDGIISGRGYYDIRMNYENNSLGDCQIRAKDPFAVYPDPDGDSYDPNENWNYIVEPRWVSLDEIALTYGEAAEALVSPLIGRSGYAGMPLNIAPNLEEITPWRTFGGEFDRAFNQYTVIESYLANAYDPARKNVRLIDVQHYVRCRLTVIEDLETGYRKQIPDGWGQDRIAKLMAWADDQYYRRGKANPLRVVNRIGKRLRWTTMVGDIIVYDDWSPYSTFTIVPFFPYFRRGTTRGMVHDLLDPQDNVNKRESMETDIVMRTAHSGWIYHTSGLNEENKFKLEQHGAAPGLNLEWQGDPHMKPEKIQPGQIPTALDRIKQEASENLKQISLINDSLLGQLDRVQSGRAIEARQRQGVLGIQSYIDNASRTRELMGYKKLEIIQNHYTEERVIRILGEDGKLMRTTINQRDPVSRRILNDVTIGRYMVNVDETPMSKSFLSAQFEEMVELIEKGILPIEIMGDIAVDVSSLPQKDTLKKRFQAYMAAQGIPTGEEAGQGGPAVPGGPAGDSLVVDAAGNPMGPGGRVMAPRRGP